jgi:hypothetical protein
LVAHALACAARALGWFFNGVPAGATTTEPRP